MRDPELVARAQRRDAPGTGMGTMACRHSPDQVPDMAAKLSGWTPVELPGQVTNQLAAWPPGPQTGADQPPTSAYLAAGALAFALSTLRYALAMPRSFSLVEGGSQLRPSVR